MRRSSVVTKKTVILLIFSGFFSLFSYFLDQLVVQSQDQIREEISLMNSKKSKIQTLIYSSNILENSYISAVETSVNFNNQLDYLTKAIMIFNLKKAQEELKAEKDGLLTKFKEENIKKINKDYIENLHHLIKRYNFQISNQERIFNEIFTNFFITENNLDAKIIEIINAYFSEAIISTDLLKQYDFENYDEKVIKQNHNVSDKIRNQSEIFRNISQEYKDLQHEIKFSYEKNFIDFYTFLDDFFLIKNKKNYYILFSISSQITGLIFLLLLFRSLLLLRKK